jgi:hypothetical protein
MIQFTNTKEVSDSIQQVAEVGDQLKNLYFNIDTADQKVISKLENRYAETKMDIIEFLKNPSQYDMFRASPDAKQALFFKQVQEGYFNHEIGLNQELKDKIYRDFLEKFKLTPPEELMTTQEKRNLQMLQQQGNSELNLSAVGSFLNEAKFLLNIYSRTRCFEGNWNYVKNNLPGNDLLDKDAKNLLQTIAQNPHFLKDNPNHFLKNKGEYKNQAPELADIFTVVHASSLGSPEAKDKVKKYEKMFKDFAEKKPESQEILSVRNKSKPQAGVEAGVGLDKPKPKPI